MAKDKKENKAAVPETPVPEVPKSNVPENGEAAVVGESQIPEADAAPKKEKHLIPDIIRGRMPVAVVAQVRFGDQKGGTDKELAAMFGTTTGKINDIKHNATFGYVDATYKPTEAQKAEGIAWLQKHVGYSQGAVDRLIDELDGTEAATAEEAAAFEAARVAAKGQLTTKKDGTPAAAGGGNRKGAKKPVAGTGEAKPSPEPPTAKDLLA